MIIRIPVNNFGLRPGLVSDDHKPGWIDPHQAQVLSDLGNVMPNRDANVTHEDLTLNRGVVIAWRVEFNEHTNRDELVISIKEEK